MSVGLYQARGNGRGTNWESATDAERVTEMAWENPLRLIVSGYRSNIACDPLAYFSYLAPAVGSGRMSGFLECRSFFHTNKTAYRSSTFLCPYTKFESCTAIYRTENYITT
jgi:hypothetical protein